VKDRLLGDFSNSRLRIPERSATRRRRLGFGAMKRIRHSAWLACIAACLVGACGQQASSSAEKEPETARGAALRPDIILVSIDSLRFDHLGCYGYKKPTSPDIDRIASEGVRCESAVSTTSWTLPAHVAMMTGLFDSTHGVVDNGLRLSDARPTLASMLHDNGYQTAGFFGGPYLHPAFGFGHGFEHYESCMSPSAPSERSASGDSSTTSTLAPTLADLDRSHADVTGPRTVEAVTRWLEHAPDDRPMFLFVHLWDVHYDYNPPREYIHLFDPGYDGTLDAHDLMTNPAVNEHMAPRDFDHLLALYDGEIRFTDDNLARILDAVDRKRRKANTLLVVTADHGEEFFEHRGKGHQRTLFDEVVRVPMIVRWPGHLTAGRVVPDQVRLVDLFPTLLGAAGVSDPPRVQGRDIMPLLRGETLAAAPALCELLVDKKEARALRTNALKVFEFRLAHFTCGYDLVRDPREELRLAGDTPRVRTALGELENTLEAGAKLRSEIGASEQPTKAGEDIERRIHGLGYGGAEEPRPK
jgi:arylsulfatase A-like enzyme